MRRYLLRGFRLSAPLPECVIQHTYFRRADVTFVEAGSLGFHVGCQPANNDNIGQRTTPVLLLHVTHVEPGSRAEALGVRNGLKIRAIFSGTAKLALSALLRHVDLRYLDFDLDFGTLFFERPLTLTMADLNMSALP
jgi:uncharacterized protein related to proFAR isomerase